MAREISTYPISKAAMWQELEFVAQALADQGHHKLAVSFGFNWAEEFHAKWEEVTLTGPELLAEVRQMEATNKGELGLNDLNVRVPELGLAFFFCNDSDVHLRFKSPNDLTESFYQRWKERGFTPVERENVEGQPATKKIREN